MAFSCCVIIYGPEGVEGPCYVQGQPVAEVDLGLGLGLEPGTLSSTPCRVGDKKRETEVPEQAFGPDHRPTVATHTFCNWGLPKSKSWLCE